MQSQIVSRSSGRVDSAASIDAGLPAETEVQQLETEHRHRWRVEEQHGAQSSGTCACGATRDFENGWSGDRSLRLNAGWLTGRSNLRSAVTDEASADEGPAGESLSADAAIEDLPPGED